MSEFLLDGYYVRSDHVVMPATKTQLDPVKQPFQKVRDLEALGFGDEKTIYAAIAHGEIPVRARRPQVADPHRVGQTHPATRPRRLPEIARRSAKSTTGPPNTTPSLTNHLPEKTVMTLDDDLDREMQGWRPNAGDRIVGTIEIDERESKYPKDDGSPSFYPVVTIQADVDDGYDVVVHGFHTVLKNSSRNSNRNRARRSASGTSVRTTTVSRSTE